MRRQRLVEHLLALAKSGAHRQGHRAAAFSACDGTASLKSIEIGSSSTSTTFPAFLAAFSKPSGWRSYSSAASGGTKKSPSVRWAHVLAEEAPEAAAAAPASSTPKRGRRATAKATASEPSAATAPAAAVSSPPPPPPPQPAAAAKPAPRSSSSSPAKEKKTTTKKATTAAAVAEEAPAAAEAPAKKATKTTKTTTTTAAATAAKKATTTKAAAAATPPRATPRPAQTSAASRWLSANDAPSPSRGWRNNQSNNDSNNNGGRPRHQNQNQNRSQNQQQQQRDSWLLGEGEQSNNRRRSWNNNSSDRGSSSSSPSQWNDNYNQNNRRRQNNNNHRYQQQQHDEMMQQQQAHAKKKKKTSKLPSGPLPPLPPLVIPVGVTPPALARLLGVTLERLEAVLASIDASPPSEEDPVEPDAAELAALELLGGGGEGEEEGVAAAVGEKEQKRPRRTIIVERPPDDDASAAAAGADVAPRPPVVAVLGHVDHGKTSLLDALRKTAVASTEAGGITQATGAFEVRMPGSGATITFLDTPGHAAFAAMRARGAAMTDVAVLVVDARDGVKPQTKEAIAHVRGVGSSVSMVVAITKCDLPDADPAAVRRQLLGEGVELEEVGGAVQVVEVSAVRGQGLRELEEALLLQAELMALRAPRKGLPGAPTEAVVVESRLAQGHGPVATVIVRRGTLEPGQVVAVGREWGKIRSLTDASGDKNAKMVLPGHAAEVSGLRGVPVAGDRLVVLPTEERARALASARAAAAADAKRGAAAAAVGEQRRRAEEDAAAAAAAAAASSLSRQGRRSTGKAAAAQAFADEAAANAAAAAAAGNGDDPSQQQQNRRLLLVLKADTQGAVEALEESLVSLSTEEVPVRVSSSGVGPVTLSDVQHAAAVGGRVLAYGSASAARGGGAAVEREARRLGVPLSCHRVIYHAIDAVAAAVAGAAPPVAREAVSGQAEVLATFSTGGGGGGAGGGGGGGQKSSAVVAGLKVIDGAILKAESFRVLRGGKVLHEGLKAATLRRHKLDVERVGAGTECGLVLEGWRDPKPGDVVECVKIEWVSPSAAEVAEAAEAKNSKSGSGNSSSSSKGAGKARAWRGG